MALVWNGKSFKPVKNLGYLLNHWKEIERFVISDMETIDNKWDCELKAIFKPDKNQTVKVFYCVFASKTVLLDWLKRPVFYGALVSDEQTGNNFIIEKD